MKFDSATVSIPRIFKYLRSEGGQTAGLAMASMANNAIQLGFTMLVTRMLGVEIYSHLAAVIAGFLVLQVSGTAIQSGAARAMALWSLDEHHRPYSEVASWTRRMLIFSVIALGLGILLREQIAALIGVNEYPWAAALLPFTGALWMLVCLQRGALLGIGRYGVISISIVLEAALRLIAGLALILAGMKVTGGFAATTLAFAALAIGLDFILRRQHVALEETSDSGTPVRIWDLIVQERIVIVAMLMIALLQNVDLIIAKRVFDDNSAGIYAAASVAAKAVVWVALAVAQKLLPDATKSVHSGDNAHHSLFKALGFLIAVGVPAILIFIFFPDLIFKAFNTNPRGFSVTLPYLGLAMLMLSISMLAVQFLSALGKRTHIPVLALIVVAEIWLLTRDNLTLNDFALVSLFLQTASAVLILGLAIFAKSNGNQSLSASSD